MQKTVRIIGILTFAFLTTCVTTNVNSPGRQSPEESFFEEVSSQDRAYSDAGIRELEKKDDGCACPQKTPPGYRTGEKETEPGIVHSGSDSETSGHLNKEDHETVATDYDEQNPAGGSAPSIDEDSSKYGDYSEKGTASWYGRDFDGKPTASGEIFDSRELTGAHKELPLGSIVLVRNLENNKEVILKINDRGPFVQGRILDVSEYAAEVLGFKDQGLTTVGIRIIRAGKGKANRQGATAEFFRGKDPHKAVTEVWKKNNPKSGELKTYQESDLSGYSVQVGAYTSIANAARVKEELSKYNQPVFVVKRSDTDFTVRIGEFNERFAAEQLQLKLSEDGMGGFISSPQQ